MNTPGYFAIIPASVRYDKALKMGARLLYGEITALCNQSGICTARNDYFAGLYEVDDKTISRWISQLRDGGYIDVKILHNEGNKREIAIDKKVTRSLQKTHEVVTKKSRGSDKIVTPIKENITINNTINSEENAHDFLMRICLTDYETFCMQFKTALGQNWDPFVADFNVKVIKEELTWKPAVLFARMRQLAQNWIRTEQNRKNNGVNVVPAGVASQPQYRKNIV